VQKSRRLLDILEQETIASGDPPEVADRGIAGVTSVENTEVGARLQVTGR
jgi:hypothetical protein